MHRQEVSPLHNVEHADRVAAANDGFIPATWNFVSSICIVCKCASWMKGTLVGYASGSGIVVALQTRVLFSASSFSFWLLITFLQQMSFSLQGWEQESFSD